MVENLATKGIPKGQKFSWRLIHGTIPCNCILANRHIITSSLCPMCKVHCEDIRHGFFTCSRVQEIWDNLGIKPIIEEACNAYHDRSEVFDALMRQKEKTAPDFEMGLKELIATTCWYIWWERRQVTHDENITKPARSAQSIAAVTLNYYKSAKAQVGVRRHGWEKPL